MRIVSFMAENFKKIKVAQIVPKGNIIKITGANASGKTSTLDGIAMALVGTRGGPTAPVRRGAERGMVRLDLDEFIVTRQWYEGGATKGEMWIEAKDGKRYGSPQAVLDGIMGKISFDPLAFASMEAKQQADQLRMLLDLDEPLTKLRATYDADYETRKEETKTLNSLKALRAVISYPEGLPAKRRDIEAMVAELVSVSGHNEGIAREQRERDDRKGHRDVLARDIEQNRTEIEELREKIAALEAETAQWEAALKDADKEIKKWKPLAEPKDAAVLAEEITAARGINAAIDKREQGVKLDRDIETATETVAKLNRAMDDNRQEAADLIAKAQYPIPGLGFSDGEVTFNDLPFTQASDAERIKVSIAIAMIGNPKLRVMRIKDGSLLDSDSMAVVEQMADQHDYQVWLEIVDQSGAVGVYLVDGEVAAVDGVPVTEQPKPVLAPARKKRATTQQDSGSA